MVSYNEKKAIEEQNSNWGSRKKPKKNIDKKSHPWYFTDRHVKYNMSKIWIEEITPENRYIIEKNNPD